MRNLSLCVAALIAACVCTENCIADIITFDVEATDAVQGGVVNWSIFITVSDVESDNFGIDTATNDLTDGGGHSLTPGTIGAPFQDYTFKDGGTPSGSSLVEIGATLLAQSSAAEAPFGGDLGPLEFASGSFIATNVGTFDLTMVAGTANRYFTADGQNTGGGNEFESQIFNPGSYTVSAVPEPMSTLPLVSMLLLCALKRKRKN